MGVDPHLRVALEYVDERPVGAVDCLVQNGIELTEGLVAVDGEYQLHDAFLLRLHASRKGARGRYAVGVSMSAEQWNRVAVVLHSGNAN